MLLNFCNLLLNSVCCIIVVNLGYVLRWSASHILGALSTIKIILISICFLTNLDIAIYKVEIDQTLLQNKIS